MPSLLSYRVRNHIGEASFSRNPIGDAAANVLAGVMTSNTHLKVLNLGASEGIRHHTEGWRAVFDALQSPRCLLQELHLGVGNGLRFGNEDVAYLSSSLVNNCMLRHLDSAAAMELDGVLSRLSYRTPIQHWRKSIFDSTTSTPIYWLPSQTH